MAPLHLSAVAAARNELEAVHDLDLLDLVESLELEHALEAGDLWCNSCSGPVSPRSIGLLASDGARILVVHEKASCMAEFLGRSRHILTPEEPGAAD
ncbi:MAG TPA: hypothetical protein VF529_05815 [Solirubrobacteraceae bacterium]|jgi:hypothetical protein